MILRLPSNRRNVEDNICILCGKNTYFDNYISKIKVVEGSYAYHVASRIWSSLFHNAISLCSYYCMFYSMEYSSFEVFLKKYCNASAEDLITIKQNEVRIESICFSEFKSSGDYEVYNIMFEDSNLFDSINNIFLEMLHEN